MLTVHNSTGNNSKTPITGIVLPPPVIDPFSSNFNFPATSSANAPTTTPAAIPASAPITTTITTNNEVTKPNVNESFANFDAVQFDSAPDPWSASKTTEVTPAKVTPGPPIIGKSNF